MSMGPTLAKTTRELHPGVSGDSVGMSRIVATFIGYRSRLPIIPLGYGNTRKIATESMYTWPLGIR